MASIHKSNYICLKCGDHIEDDSKVMRIEYKSNKKHKIYLHRNCYIKKGMSISV